MDALVFRDFGFSYATAPDHAVLSQINWTVPAGSFSLVEGPTGCGKTTLLRMAHPVLAPAGTTQGQLEALGETLFPSSSSASSALSSASSSGASSASSASSASHTQPSCDIAVAYVGQHAADQIVCDSVWHELAFGLENRGTPQDTMRRRVAEVAHYFGIESWLHEPTASLSGGQQQILNLASALAMRPALLLLDEPTAQLDPVAAHTFIDALARVNRELNITVVVATHSPWEFAAYTTNRLTLEHSLAPSPTTVANVARTPHVHIPDAEYMVVIDNAYLRYERDLPWVLRGMDISVATGSIHALVGGNGCGKSTVLKAIAGVAKPTHGHITNNSRAQAMLPQDPKLLMVCDTVAEELHEWQHACGYTEDAVAHEVERFGLSDILNNHPFDTSGGQQQKIAFAKIALTNPDLVLLDEPTKGLDAHTRRQLADELRAMKEAGATVVLATHDLAFVKHVADNVSTIFDGQTAQTEPPQQYFADNLFMRPDHEALIALESE